MNPDKPESTAVVVREAGKMPQWKKEWQQRSRDAFKSKYGYSQTTHYRFKGAREHALRWDGYCCVKCGMTDAEHKAAWGRPITVDHKDKNERNNSLHNLQTLCLSCHGTKDISPQLIEPKRKIPVRKMAELRDEGKTFREIGIIAGIDGSRCRKLIIQERSAI